MNTPEQTNTPAPKKQRKTNRPALVAYMIALFSVAFLLLLMSYFMQQRRNDQQLIAEGIEKNASALQITQSVQRQNEALRQQVAELEESLTAQAKEQENTTHAMDWLWRIQREYFQRRYSSARQMIRDFEETGLKDYLPAEPPIDPDYRSPLEQYEAIYNALF